MLVDFSIVRILALVLLPLACWILWLISDDLRQLSIPDSLFHCTIRACVKPGTRRLTVVRKTPRLGLVFHNDFPLPKEFVPGAGKGIEIFLARTSDKLPILLITLQTVDVYDREIEVSFHPKTLRFGKVKHSPPVVGSVRS